MDAHGAVLNPLSKRIIGCGLRVAGTLGNGFLEKVYENALAHELRKAGLGVEQQRGITVMYDGVMVGEYFIDLLVEGKRCGPTHMAPIARVVILYRHDAG